MRTILIQGASTAAGWYDMEQAGWANRLTLGVLPINQMNPQEAILVQNDSVPGTTLPAIMREMMPRVDRLQRMGSLTTVLAIGINESKIRGGTLGPSVPLTSFQERLEEYAEGMHSRNIRTVYVGTELLLRECIVTDNGNIFRDDLAAEYDEVIGKHAQNNGMPYIPMRTILSEIDPRETVSSDGLHPSAIGHQMIYEAVAKALDNMNVLEPRDRPAGIHPQNV